MAHAQPSAGSETTIEPERDPSVHLVLRGVNQPRERQSSRRVVWTEDTVDNEGLGRKKSKSTFSTVRCCCHLSAIYALTSFL